jgi:phosphate starvation-inducible PhoH-like protein
VATGITNNKVVIAIPSAIPMVAITGPADSYLRQLEKAFSRIAITVRRNELIVRGDDLEIEIFQSLISELLTVIRSGQDLSEDSVRRSIAMVVNGGKDHPAEVLSLNILSNRGKTIRPKTANQKRYVEAIDRHTITFGIGPAGTGKTYLAMAKAVHHLDSTSSRSRRAVGISTGNSPRKD